LETSLVFHSHPPEVTWEEYAFGRLSEKKIPPLEEHLLVCELCQTSLEEVTEYIHLMKTGLMKVKMARLIPAPPDRLARVSRFLRPAGRPRGVIGAMAMAAGCMALWIAVRAAPSRETALSLIHVPTQVTLDSFRDDGIAHAPALRPLNLSINPADITADATPDVAVNISAAAEYRLEVVTASGKQVWNSAPDVSSGTLDAHLPKGLAAGKYWVRLYTGRSEILAEFGLLLE
jgi:hypothetical protein